ncbi:hypothetical protein [Candidatus Burkholderia verschuerenii]|uniref:hypothetical protein n=1 Tax=Candidatus Burkholderia verschuerenii TaxID=242163 RepID=UPI001E5CC12B|nr:hypothetical protein [Candidatus Burkholderia verschuerenii]
MLTGIEYGAKSQLATERTPGLMVLNLCAGVQASAALADADMANVQLADNKIRSLVAFFIVYP